jgi:hypothetical protein
MQRISTLTTLDKPAPPRARPPLHPAALQDVRGCPTTGANAAALDAYEQALAAFLSWRDGAEAAVDLALRHAPHFVMAHALKAYLRVCSRDAARVASAGPLLAQGTGLPATEHERRHLGAIGAVLADDFVGAKAHLAACLQSHPRDVLALHAVHNFDHATGDVAALLERPARVLPAWSPELPGYTAMRSMLAFGWVEAGEHARGEEAALAVLAADPLHPRAHHVMAHVFEMNGQPEAGLAWMHERIARHGAGAQFSVHAWWHVALFHVARGEWAPALRLNDERVRGGRTSVSAEVADLIDAASLLWRIDVGGGPVGRRWAELSRAWAPHAEGGFCSFNDVHAMLAFVGARDGANARRLECALQRTLEGASTRPTRYGLTTRQVGAPACRALAAYGRGDHAQASTLLASLPALAHRLGGSHAQRDVLYLTWLSAIEHVRHPVRRPMRSLFSLRLPTAAAAVA